MPRVMARGHLARRLGRSPPGGPTWELWEGRIVRALGGWRRGEGIVSYKIGDSPRQGDHPRSETPQPSWPSVVAFREALEAGVAALPLPLVRRRVRFGLVSAPSVGESGGGSLDAISLVSRAVGCRDPARRGARLTHPVAGDIARRRDE